MLSIALELPFQGKILRGNGKYLKPLSYFLEDDLVVMWTGFDRHRGARFLAIALDMPGVNAKEHGALTGLIDNDHTIYHTDARADAWLATKTADDLAEGGNKCMRLAGSGAQDTGASSNHNHDGTYAPIGHENDGVYEPIFRQNTAFNKNLGVAVAPIRLREATKIISQLMVPTFCRLAHGSGLETRTTMMQFPPKTPTKYVLSCHEC